MTEPSPTKPAKATVDPEVARVSEMLKTMLPKVPAEVLADLGPRVAAKMAADKAVGS